VSRTHSGKDRKRNNESASFLLRVYHNCNLKEIDKVLHVVIAYFEYTIAPEVG